MEQQKTWRKLVLAREHFASINDIPLQIGDAVGFPPHWPKDLNIFIKRHRMDELPIPCVLYFPPASVAYCADVLADYPNEPCSRPRPSEVAVFMGVGSVSWQDE